MAYLKVTTGPWAGKIHELEKERVLMGRKSSCDIGFPSKELAVSRVHASIVQSENKFFIEDLDSHNGTFVNNVQIHGRVQLKENDIIQICGSVLSFHDPAQERVIVDASVSSTNSQASLDIQPPDKVRALIEITNNLCSTLELDSLFPKIVDSLFRLFRQADRGFIILPESSMGADTTSTGLTAKVRKTRQPENVSDSRFSRSIVRECLKTAQGLLINDGTRIPSWTPDDSTAEPGNRSIICAPLLTRNAQAFGVIQLDTQDRSKRFTKDDLGLLMAVARQASVAIDNVRLHEQLIDRDRLLRDLKLAQLWQRSFLPRKLPEVPGYEFFAYYKPALQVGGDYYDFIPIRASNKLALVLGDVAGKGVQGALLMARLSCDARFTIEGRSDLGEAISVLNDHLYENTSLMDSFVSLAAAVLDADTHQVTFVNAGHPAPLLLRHKTGKLESAIGDDCTGLLLGVIEGSKYASCGVQLEPGDVVILFSDGVTEALDDQHNLLKEKAFAVAVQEGLRDVKSLGERVVELVKQHASGRSQSDDITLVLFGRLPS